MLELKNISKQYRTGDLVQQALQDVSFNLRDNEFVSVLGPSGSGKTTLLNIIGGLDRYDSGDLIINGTSTEKYKSKDWDAYRNHTIGFVFQSYNLIQHQSILANVELALTIGGESVRERRKKAKKALEEVGLGDQLHKKPNQLSGGQMQRVAIARALVNDPDILLADEPTGALDSTTSVQIMDLLKQVASDRLVVMVTHNEELAGKYSTRIIKLRDGMIISDSDPYLPEEEKPADKEEGLLNRQKDNTNTEKMRAHMSFLTSLSLSANNLKSKMGRTILISLACSIGIIGIALILSISTGVNDYIINIQKDTMSSYPITISAQTFDLNGMMEDSQSLRDSMMSALNEGTEDDGMIHTDFSNMMASEAVSSSMVENNLTELKRKLDDPECEINDYLGENGIVYSYNVGFDVFTRDPLDVLIDTDSSVDDISDSSSMFSVMSTGLNIMRNNMFTWQYGTYAGAMNFSEMAAGGNGRGISQIIMDNYDLVYGEWPDSYDEIVVVLNANNSLPAETLYQLGLMDGQTYKEAARKYESGEEAGDFTWNYEDVCGKSYYLVMGSDRYMQNEDGTFSYIDDSYYNLESLLENAVELKVSGIIRISPEASSVNINTAMAYTADLTSYCIEHSGESAIVKAQMETPEVNVLTGTRFEAGSDEEKAADAIQYISELSTTEKAQLYTMILYYENGEIGTEDMEGSGQDLSSIMEMFGMSDYSSMISMISSMDNDFVNSIVANFGSFLTNENQQAVLLDQWLEDDPDQEILVAIYDQYLVGGSYEDNLKAFGYINKDAPASINIYTDTFEAKDQVTAWIDSYNEEADQDSQIVYTDYIALITSSVTQIVNAISYVLIAFVAISLLVSCIMIGIITHISVLERTKEIGILRAMGASKRNISQVFNAETVIIGLVSGLFGIVITLILIVPINFILRILLGEGLITVNLPVIYALMLIAISVIVTVVGGLIPAAKAAKKDPVIALRTE